MATDQVQLREELPQMEMMAIDSGAYCLNLHIVTCRKPAIPRPGDLLKDGTRQDMTRSKLDTMGHYNGKDAKWKRSAAWEYYCHDTYLTPFSEILSFI